MPAIGKVSGLTADFSRSTVNGRSYDKIFEKILSGKDERFNTMMSRGGIPCELGHPTDLDENGQPRTETDPSKVAVILTSIKRAGQNKVMGEGVICDTPNGKIFKALSEYYRFGFSSRGSYSVPDDSSLFYSEGPDGWNQDSYIFKGFDLVFLPANTNSDVSVTEGVGDKKRMKVARESIDVDLIAKASQVTSDQVEEALDQLFNVNPDAEKGEEITVRDMKDKLDEEKENLSDDGLGDTLVEDTGDDGEEEEEEDENEESIDTTLITNGKKVEDIEADLRKALEDIETVTKERDESQLKLSESNAAVDKLTHENGELRSELDERIEESERLVEKLESLKELSSKLLKSYREAKEIFDQKNEEDDEAGLEYLEAKEALESKLKDSEQRCRTAEESLSLERKVSAGLRGELKEAKESLISSYSNTYGVSTEAVRTALGKNYTVRKIKSVVESLANQVSTISSFPVFEVPVSSRKSSAATESFRATDEVEKELYEQLKNK